MSLIQHLSQIIPISADLETEINKIANVITIKKGSDVLKMNESCNAIYFINSGLVRGYYFIDGKEITNWFAQEGEFATCFYAFISNKNAFESIQAIEDCELIKVNYTDLQNLYKTHLQTERIGRILTESYYIKLEERLLGIQFKTAKERYDAFVKHKSNLLQRASLGYIASYLGITQETLSRIRADV